MFDLTPDQTKLKSIHLCLKLSNCSYFGTYSILYLAVLENKEESGTIDVRVGNLRNFGVSNQQFLVEDWKVRK